MDLCWKSLCFLICCLGCHNFPSTGQASLSFMSAVTIRNDFEAQGKKICLCFYLPWSDGTGCRDLVFWMLSFKPAFSLSLRGSLIPLVVCCITTWAEFTGLLVPQVKVKALGWRQCDLVKWNGDFWEDSDNSYLTHTWRPCKIFFSFFWLCHTACGILVLQAWIKLRPIAVQATRLNQQTTREFPIREYWFLITHSYDPLHLLRFV